MGFRSRARKGAEERGERRAGRGGAKTPLQGTVNCAISGCENWADKDLDGRSISFEAASDVWEEDQFEATNRRLRVCKAHYREWKKATKEDRDHAW